LSLLRKAAARAGSAGGDLKLAKDAIDGSTAPAAAPEASWEPMPESGWPEPPLKVGDWLRIGGGEFMIEDTEDSDYEGDVPYRVAFFAQQPWPLASEVTHFKRGG
jgi:hypothetical protein